ncbi:HNH endonuclease [Candidatus Pacearchaeota archaeon]|jgi:hypothetical protein|nr:HNH endonuclease [Candidatus Pacearchaeota archaeon]
MQSSETISATKLQSLGGQATAKKLRQESIERYYQTPSLCEQCGNIIHVEDLQVAQVRRKRFCNRVCVTRFTKNRLGSGKEYFCDNCKCKLDLKRNERGKIKYRKFCDGCYKLNRVSQSPTLTAEQKLKPNIYDFENQTKGSLFARRKNWQSASSTLRKKARIIYDSSGSPKKCYVCGYDKHYEVSHKKPVSCFQDDAKVSDINDISNLVALCRNCHWEFDHGMLKVNMSWNATK